MKSLSFHANPTVHEYLMPYDRRTWLVTTDSGMFYDIPPDFPPLKFHPTSDPMEPGSSMFYSTRVDVTEQIRSNNHLHLLENVVSQWGDCLVMVASRQERHNFLLGNICNASELSATCYMMLEEIVRHRYNGLPTTNFDGLGHCGLTPSTIWYARQKLEKLGLLTSQPYMSKYKTHTMSTGVLLHHWRFHRHFPFPNAVMLQKLVDLLHESPTKSHTLNYLRHVSSYTFSCHLVDLVSLELHVVSDCYPPLYLR
ncbi:unnamed protein product [Dicrocoelium dendriticum]|nr:unnamed protein product [Dicrocoelium dendriticum]